MQVWSTAIHLSEYPARHKLQGPLSFQPCCKIITLLQQQQPVTCCCWSWLQVLHHALMQHAPAQLQCTSPEPGTLS